MNKGQLQKLIEELGEKAARNFLLSKVRGKLEGNDAKVASHLKKTTPHDLVREALYWHFRTLGAPGMLSDLARDHYDDKVLSLALPQAQQNQDHVVIAKATADALVQVWF